MTLYKTDQMCNPSNPGNDMGPRILCDQIPYKLETVYAAVNKFTKNEISNFTAVLTAFLLSSSAQRCQISRFQSSWRQ